MIDPPRTTSRAPTRRTAERTLSPSRGRDTRALPHRAHHRPPAPRGPDATDNLALACDRCNLHKGPNLSSVDPTSGAIVNLFNPRIDRWNDHFTWEGAYIVGITTTGRATARLLDMNAVRRIRLRAELLATGEFER